MLEIQVSSGGKDFHEHNLRHKEYMDRWTSQCIMYITHNDLFVYPGTNHKHWISTESSPFGKRWLPILNPFPHNDTFWRPWETSLLKTLWEKEKLLVASNFSFFHSVFYRFE